MKFASAHYPLSWEKDDVIYFDFTYNAIDSTGITTQAETYINALKTYVANIHHPYSLNDSGSPLINIGVPITRAPRDDTITVSFTMALTADYFENGQTITATRTDFADLVDDYGIAGAFEQAFRDALDEYDDNAKLKDYVIINVTINDNTN